MSMLPQELLRKVSANSREVSNRSNETEVPDERFRELLKVNAVDENPREKGLFSIFKEEDEGESSIALVTPALPMSCQNLTSAASELAPIPLSTEIEALFEKMAACMIVMSSSDEEETTLFLDNPSSIFCGTRITIREFSTAPRTFNIEIGSNAQTIALIDAAKSSLLAAFQNGKFNFSIHRLDTEIQERPVFHRKDDADQDPKGGRDHD